MSLGQLYLIPCELGEGTTEQVIPASIYSLVNNIKYFIVEDPKSARHYLKRLKIQTPINELILFELNKHSDKNNLSDLIKPLLEGHSMGIISEAGCPCIADPGSEIVKLAHQHNIKVLPLTGPSSILLSLMASGFNGQSFTFHGYLPIDKNDRSKKLKQLEKDARAGQTQLFIETPFRNNQMMDDLLNILNTDTKICVACDITLPEEFIKTLKVSQWKSQKPDLHKKPCIFLIGN